MSAKIRHGEDQPPQPTEAVEPVDELQQLQDKNLRLQAEIENLGKRLKRKYEEDLRFASQGLLTELLGALDAFELALTPNSLVAGKETLIAGFAQIWLMLQDALRKHGVQRLEASEGPVDPNYHEVVQMVESPLHPHTIVQTTRAGYLMHDRVVRPAQVAVSQGESNHGRDAQSEIPGEAHFGGL